MAYLTTFCWKFSANSLLVSQIQSPKSMGWVGGCTSLGHLSQIKEFFWRLNKHHEDDLSMSSCVSPFPGDPGPHVGAGWNREIWRRSCKVNSQVWIEGRGEEEKSPDAFPNWQHDKCLRVWWIQKIIEINQPSLALLINIFLAMLVALQLTPVSEGLTRSFGIAAA